MFDAVHAKTGKWYHSWAVWHDFPDPDLAHSEEWYCCPDCKKPVTPVIKHFRKLPNSKEEICVNSHFRLLNLELGDCIHGESDEHRNLKFLLANLVENEKITLGIDNLSLNFKDLKINGVPYISYRWEQIRGNRRADVLIEFKEWHPLLGRGIDFELQKTTIPEYELANRENDWIKQGYSMAWLPLDIFDEESLKTNLININVIWIYRLFQIKYNELSELIKQYEINNETRFKQLENNFIKQLDTRINQMVKKRMDSVESDLRVPESERFCENCKHFAQDRRNPNRRICWRGISPGEHKRPFDPDPRGVCVFWSFR